MNELTREEARKCGTWIAGTLQRLESVNLFEGGLYRITARGVSMYDQLVASGYRPNPAHIRFGLVALTGNPSPDQSLIEILERLATESDGKSEKELREREEHYQRIGAIDEQLN